MEISRRRFFFGAATSLIAAPAVIRTVGLLMPIKSIKPVVLVNWSSWFDHMLAHEYPILTSLNTIDWRKVTYAQ